MRHHLRVLFIVTLTLWACSPATSAIEETAILVMPSEGYLSATPDVYFLLSSRSFPITYGLAHMPAECLLASLTCDELELVSQFPSTEFSPSSDTPFHWSPDGSQVLIFNGNNSKLLIMDQGTSKIVEAPNDLNLISDQVAWSPDSKWVAVSTPGADEFTSQIALLDPLNYAVRRLSTDPGGILYPISWKNDHELVVLQVKYGFSNEQADQKKVIVGVDLILLEINGIGDKVLIPDLKLRGDSLPTASPVNGFIVISVIRSEMPSLEIYTGEGMLQNSFEGFTNPIWSPDGEKIAAILNEDDSYSLYVLDPVNGGTRELLDLLSLPDVTWLPDGSGLVATSLVTDEQGNEMTAIYFVSTTGEIRELDVAALVGSDQMVLGISFGP